MTASPLIDSDYRKMVRDAAGDDYLRAMTDECMALAQALLQERPAPDDATRARAHRLAGGTATAGLLQVAAALKALEKACGANPADDAWSALLADGQAALAAAQAALSAEASTFSSR